MDAGAIAMSVFSNAIVAFSRSSGPGGQNVNKVNTKVTASIALEKIEGLSQAERIAVKARLSGRIRGDGVLQVRVQETRNQCRNREIALERMISLIIRAAGLKPARIPTKPSAAKRRQILDAKRVHGNTKRNRQSPSPEY